MSQTIGEGLGQAAHGNGAKQFPVVGMQGAMIDAAELHSLFEHRIEHWGEIAGRGIDDLQYFSGGGLLLQGLARLSNEPRVFHCDHRLRSKVLQ